VLRCIHCGEPSGLLRRQHAACRERHDAAIGQFPGFFVKFMASPMPLDKFRALADEIATGARIRGEEFKAVCAGGIEAMVVAATASGELTPEDSAHITTLAEAFGVDLHALPRAGLRLAKASVLRELKEGKLPAGIDVEGPVISISSAMNRWFGFSTMSPATRSRAATSQLPTASRLVTRA
jgi:hypothetical protein